MKPKQENQTTLNNLEKANTLISVSENPMQTKMKNADRPFLLIILIAISLLYTIMAFLS
jgi:hypothetical protein